MTNEITIKINDRSKEILNFYKEFKMEEEMLEIAGICVDELLASALGNLRSKFEQNFGKLEEKFKEK